MGVFNEFNKNTSTTSIGKEFEKHVYNYLRKKVQITNKGKVYSYKGRKRHVEIDIETASTAIEVKSGKASNLSQQLDRYSDVTTKEPVALAPNMRNRNKQLTRKKYKVFDTEEELSNYLISKGDGKKKRRK